MYRELSLVASRVGEREQVGHSLLLLPQTFASSRKDGPGAQVEWPP